MDLRAGRLDPLAQTFRVSAGSATIGSPGAFLTKIDLFFAGHDSVQDTMIEIREVDPATAYVTNLVVPMSRVYVSPSEVNTSVDGSAPTPIIFPTPIYLMNNVEYAFVIKPVDANPNVTLFTARLGEDDLVTGNRVTENPHAGVLFISANDRTWQPMAEEDLKFKIYFANFGTNQTGTAVYKNIDKEYFTIANTSGSLTRVGEEIHGETTLTMGGALSANVGDTLVGGTSVANGTITYVSGSTVRVKDVTLASKYTDAETLTVYNGGIASGTTGTLSSQVTPTGEIFMYDAITQSNTALHISVPSSSFSANTWLKTQSTGGTALISSIDNISMDTFKTTIAKFDLQDTTTALTGKFGTSASARDTSFQRINPNADTFYDARRYMFSRSNEVANLSGTKSGEIVATLTNGSNPRHSPAIDNDRTGIISVENMINNDTTNEASTASGGNSLARYVQRVITLADGQDAEDLKVFVGAYNPSTATIQIYAKFLNGEDGGTIEDQTWLELTQTTSSTVVSDSENTNDFNEYEFSIPTASLTGGNGEFQYLSSGVTYTGFKRFKIKVVLSSTNPARVPRIRDFRSIALQI